MGRPKQFKSLLPQTMLTCSRHQSEPSLCWGPPCCEPEDPDLRPLRTPVFTALELLCFLQPPYRKGSESTLTGTRPVVTVQPVVSCVSRTP